MFYMDKRELSRIECRRQFLAGNRKNFIISIVALVGFTLSQLLIAFVLKNITEAMEMLDKSRIYKTIIIGVIAAGVALISGILEKVYTNRYVKQGLSQFKQHVFTKIFDKSIGQFGSTSNSTFISAFSNDLNLIETNYLSGLLQIIMQVLLLVGGTAAMGIMSWELMLYVLAMTTLPVIISLRYGTKIIDKEKTMSEKNEDFVDQVKDLLSGFIVVKSFKAEKEVLQLFENQNTELEEAKRDRRQTSNNVGIISEASSTLVVVGMIFIGTYFVFKGKMTIGAVLGFIQLQNYTLGPIKNLVPLWSNRKASSLLIDKMADMIEEDGVESASDVVEGLDGEIVIDNVSFAYEEGMSVLKNVSAVFKKGKSYAIVGNSGSGKSTLLGLLMGHSYAYTGDIRFDSKELRTISLDSLYDVVSVVQQNVFLFDSSLKDNVTMFKEFDEGKYVRAVARAGLSELVEQKGDTYACGAGGRNLSGGEKQRVSIARCLIRETPVLMMDEATASLDNATAMSVSSAILAIEGLTRIVVTHKLEEAILRQYDEIIVLHNGAVVETGKFEDLMEDKKYFYSLFNVSQE